MNKPEPTADDLSKARRKPAVRASSSFICNIPIVGNKDPRGPDNNVIVWIDDEGLLRIRVWKTDRCYRFKGVIDTPGYVEIVAK